jgi:MFS family permease
MLDIGVYRRVLALPGFVGFLGRGLLLRVPNIAAPVVLTLYVATGPHGANFAAAGLVVALWPIGMAVGSPVQGWFIDRHGFRPLFVAATLVQAGFWGCALVVPFPVLAVAAFVSGLSMVSAGTITRLAISAIVPEDIRHTAFSINSMLTGFSVLVVPPIAVVIVTRVGVASAVLGVGAVFVLSCLWLAARTIPLERPRTGSAFGGLRSMLSGKLILTFAGVAAIGVMTSGGDIALLATLNSVGQTAWAGVVLAVCAASALLGGFLYGGRSRGLPPAPLVVAVGLGTAAIGIWADWRWMAVAFVPTALLVSWAQCATADTAGKLADPRVRATVMSTYGAAVTAGAALGPPLAGAVFDLGSHQLSFLVIGGIGVLAGLLALGPLRSVAPAGDAVAVPAGSSATDSNPRK